jgi:hypothetical protein
VGGRRARSAASRSAKEMAATRRGRPGGPAGMRQEEGGGGAGAAAGRPLLEHQAGAGLPGHQRLLPAHTGFQVPEIGCPVLPRPRRAQRLPPPPLPPSPTRSRPSPQAIPSPENSGCTGHPGIRLAMHRLQLSTVDICWHER